jgi:predicted PurR-regulated permease PerM
MSSDSVSQTLFQIVFGGAILYFGRALFIPLSYGLFIALLLYPVCRWLEQKKVSRPLSILLSLGLLSILLGIIIYLLFRQLAELQVLWPGLKAKLQVSMTQWTNDLGQYLNITQEQGNQLLSQGFEKSLGSLFGILGNALGRSISSVVNLLLIPIYTYLILFYRTQFVRALTLLVPDRMQSQMSSIMSESVNSYVEFIKGMMTVYLIVGILNSTGLLILGIPHALLFGFIASIMTFIPYVGIMIASLLPIAVS